MIFGVLPSFESMVCRGFWLKSRKSMAHSVVWWSKMGSTAKINLAWFSNKRHIVFTVTLICCCDDPSSYPLWYYDELPQLSIEKIVTTIKGYDANIYDANPTILDLPTDPTPRIPAYKTAGFTAYPMALWRGCGSAHEQLATSGGQPGLRWFQASFNHRMAQRCFFSWWNCFMNPTTHHRKKWLWVVGERSCWYLKTFFEGFHLADEEW